MMLTTSCFAPPMQRYSAYTPPRSSPLSERSANANATPRLFDCSMGSPSNEKKPAAAQRAFKPNPVMQTRDAATKRRRDMFFRRVQNGREDRKWESRGEQIQHLDFVSERRRWEAEKLRQAPAENNEYDEQVQEDAPLPVLARNLFHPEQDTTEADLVASREEFELQELIASMEQDNDAASQHFGSDDEDYDALFMECVTMVDEQYQQQPQHTSPGFTIAEDVDMDMEMTYG